MGKKSNLTAAGKPKVCSSCGAGGHCLATFRGCINHGKPKEQWQRVPGAAPVAAAAPPKKKKERWIKSRGKQLLRDAIIAGTVTSKSDPAAVHSSNPEWEKWPLPNFKTNLKNLIEVVAFDYKRMAEDCEGYGHDIALLKQIRELDPIPEPTPWHLSDGEPLLKKDIDDGKHEKMVPIVLWATRVEFMEFELKVFRDHIYQELKRREKKITNARFQKKKKRLPPPPRAGVVDKSQMNLVDEGLVERRRKK